MDHSPLLAEVEKVRVVNLVIDTSPAISLILCVHIDEGIFLNFNHFEGFREP